MDTSKKFPVALRGSWFGLNQQLKRRISGLAITPAQYTVIRNIFEHAEVGLNQCILSRLLSSNQNNITAILKRLEALELIERKYDDRDRRSKLISLTAKGLSVYKQAQKVAQSLEGDLYEYLGEKEHETLLKHLGACQKNLEHTS